MVAARLAVARITAVGRLGGNNNQIAGPQQLLLTIAETARFPLDNRPNGELRMAMTFIGLSAVPGTAQLQPGQLFVAPKGLLNIARMAHGGLLS